MRLQLRAACVLFVLLTILTGIIYPAIVTLVAKVGFPRQAGGSLFERDGKVAGSELIGQPFSDARYFWPRPSATSPVAYAADAGAGSNQGTNNPALIESVKQRIAALKSADPTNNAPIPIDLVTASASGLDPHISIAAARYQAPRIARARNRSLSEVLGLVDHFTEGRTMGILGEPRINVLKLNLALDNR